MLEIQEIVKSLQEIDRQSPVVNRDLAIAESNYRALEKREKVLFYSIVSKMEGKSMAERECNAYASKDYSEFVDGLNAARFDYLKAKANSAALEDKKAVAQSLNKLLIKELEFNYMPNVDQRNP
jgi:hypothetical protein